MDPVLMRMGKYEFAVSDFESVYHKNNLTGKQKLDECLSQYIPYKLKVVAAKDAGLDTLASFTGEWTKYRDLFAGKCLIDSIIDDRWLHEAYERSCYELKTAHIVLKVTDTDTLLAYNRIMQIRREALSGKDFGELAACYSDDSTAKVNHGELEWFSVFRMAYPFETAAYHIKPGELSMPVRTAFGYHLIKVYDRRPLEQKQSFEEMKPGLRQQITRNDRMETIMDSYIATLKKRYSFMEDISLLKKSQHTNIANNTLFSFAGKDVSWHDFEQYAEQPGTSTTSQAYKQLVASTLLDCENSRLESNQEFVKVVDEYYDGLLLFDIMEREIWSKAAQDTGGFAAFYTRNAKSYRWGKRMMATVYYCSDQQTAVRSHQAVHNRNVKAVRLPDDLFNFFCDKDGASPCVDTVRLILPWKENTVADQVKWKKGCSKILEWNGKFVFLDVHAILPPKRKTFEEARSEALADYQDELERQWIEQLKKEYPVTVDQVVWTDLKKKYAD